MNEDPNDMFREMEEMFSHLFTRMARDFATGDPQVYGCHIIIRNHGEPSRVPESPAIQPRSSSEPVPEVHRIGDEVKVITELPGATMDMITFDLKGSILAIDADGGGHHYHTSAALPAVDPASMQTSFKNGVLEVTFRANTTINPEPPSAG